MTTGMTTGQLHTSSLRRRVTVLVLATQSLVIVAIVVLANILFGIVSNRDVTAVLNNRTLIAEQLARQSASPTRLLNRLEGGGVRVDLVLPDGTRYGTVLGPTTSTNSSKNRTRTVPLVAPGKPLDGAVVTLQVEDTVIDAPQARLRQVLLFIGLGALVVTGAVLVVVIRLGLRPLDTMTNLARTIASGGRGRRLWPTRTDTELGRTAAAFDNMLDALEGAEAQARTAEAAARTAEAAARASAERTKRFVADAAHELRTPIAGVAAVAEAVLQQPPDTDPEERERLHLLLVRESRRAGQLVDDLLDLARIDAGVELNRAPVDLRALAEGQADRIRLLAPELTVEVSGPELTVFADAARITQILANLLDNARQATPPDGRISIVLDTSGPFAEVLVIDSGYGVPPEERDRIFDRLVRLDEARDRRSGGSGLGLAIARGFARAHGGELSCEYVPPGTAGAVFRLLLPIGPEA